MERRKQILEKAIHLLESWSPREVPSDERLLRALHWVGLEHWPADLLSYLKQASSPYGQLLAVRLAHRLNKPLVNLPRHPAALLRLVLNSDVDYEVRAEAARLLRQHGTRWEALQLLQRAENMSRRGGISAWREIIFLCKHMPDVTEVRLLRRLADLIRQQRVADSDLLRRLAGMPSPVVVNLLDQLIRNTRLFPSLRAVAVELLGKRTDAHVNLTLVRLARKVRDPLARQALLAVFLERSLQLSGCFEQQEIYEFLRSHCPEHLLQRLPAHLHHRMIRQVLAANESSAIVSENEVRLLTRPQMTAFRKCWLLMQRPKQWYYLRKLEPVGWSVFNRWLLAHLEQVSDHLHAQYAEVVAPAVSPALLKAMLPRALEAVRLARKNIYVEIILRARGETARQARQQLFREAVDNDLKRDILEATVETEKEGAIEFLKETWRAGWWHITSESFQKLLAMLPEDKRLTLLQNPPFPLPSSCMLETLKTCDPSVERNRLLCAAARSTGSLHDVEMLVQTYHDEARLFLIDLSAPFLRISSDQEWNIVTRQVELLDEVILRRVAAMFWQAGFEPNRDAMPIRTHFLHLLKELQGEIELFKSARERLADDLLTTPLCQLYPVPHLRGHVFPGCWTSMLLEEPAGLMLTTWLYRTDPDTRQFSERCTEIARLIEALSSAFELAHFIEQHNEALRRRRACLVLHESSASEARLRRIVLDWRRPSSEVIYRDGRLIDTPVLIYCFKERQLEQPATGDVLLGTLSYLLREHPEKALQIKSDLQELLRRRAPAAPTRTALEKAARQIADMLSAATPLAMAPRSMGCGLPLSLTEKQSSEKLYPLLKRAFWTSRDLLSETSLQQYVEFARHLQERKLAVALQR